MWRRTILNHNTYTGARVRTLAEMSGLIISVEDRDRTAALNPPCLYSGFIKWRRHIDAWFTVLWMCFERHIFYKQMFMCRF